MDPVVGIIWEITKCLCVCAKDEIAYINDLEENLKFLKNKWEELERKRQDLQIKVDEAEKTRGMQRTQEIDGWMKMVDALQKGIEVIQVQGDREVQNKCISKCCPRNCMSSYKSGKNVAMVLKNVDELINKGEKFLKKDVEIAHRKLPRPLEVPLYETVGLDWMVDKVWNCINKEENVGVIGLYGMGGVGKTTLLNIIYNELMKKRKDFDILMRVVVSREPNLDSIMDNIRKKLRIEDNIWGECSNRDEKAGKIYEVLRGKKFVLLLDDIWESLELNMVGVPHPKDTDFQSKVLFTTRLEDVCEKMKAQRTFKLEILMENKAFELFCMHVGENTLKSHVEIQKLAREIAAKCKGLPLALVKMGSAMSGVKNVKAWEDSRRDLTSSPWTTSVLKNVYSILKFSYGSLPDETHKKCFLYCALYPDDYKILVSDLIDKWIWEGLLGDYTIQSIQGLCDRGESVIERLKLSCLLEIVEDDLSFSRTVKLHGLIRDMALWLVCDQDKNERKILVLDDASSMPHGDDVIWKFAEKISITTSRVPGDASSKSHDDDKKKSRVAGDASSTSHDNVKKCVLISITEPRKSYIPTICPNLRTLMSALTNFDGKITIDLGEMQHISRLKILDLSCGPNTMIVLPKQIGDLFFLEYLSLKGQMKPSEFPLEMGNLRNLKFFWLRNLYHDDPSNIPLNVISSLTQLRVWRFTTNAELSWVPLLPGVRRQAKDAGATKLRSIEGEERAFFEKLESLPNLQELMLQIKTADGLKKLLESTMLQSCLLYLYVDFKTQIHMQVLVKAMSKMKQLQRIWFSNFTAVEDSSVFDTHCLCKLRSVSISKCHSLTHLTWLKHAPLLEDLNVEDCRVMEEVIKGGMADEKGKDINVNSTCAIFPSLVKLRLWILPKLKSIHKTALSFPSLRFIEIYSCLSLDKLPLDSNSANELRHIRGGQKWWDNLKWEDPAIKDKFLPKLHG